MTVRRATEADEPALRALWEAFVREATFTPYPGEAFARALIADHVALLAEDDGEPAGAVYANLASPHFGYVFGLYVAPAARRRGVATALMRAVAERVKAEGREHLVLSVDTPNAPARRFYERLGFVDAARTLRIESRAVLEPADDDGRGATFGSIHVQTDDEPAVERAVRQFVPRLPGASRGSVLAAPRNGWVAVYDDVCDRDPKMLRGLARELSDRMGAVVLEIGVIDGAVVHYTLLERGTIMDEYVSVPEHDGPLPPGDVIALAANPRVTARLTGAQPERVRAVARQAATSSELPPAGELLRSVAAVLGVEGTEHGWADAPDAPGYRRLDR